ncbi:MAG: hypothetical protein QME41_07620 [Actinomycetota bacterium]|nr:hypothetical protein [Actinomycetota bacterium]
MRADQVRNLIVNWHDKALRENDVFSKFVFHWFCFNAWLAHESGRYADRAMLDWLRQNRASRLSCAFDLIVDRSAIDRLIALSPIRGDATRHNQRDKFDIYISNNNDFDNIVEAIYRIRCNLFHRRKEADDIRDQQLVDACGGILKGWIHALILNRGFDL